MGKILVTGGLGFIGSNLINLLLKKNYKVLNIDKVTYASNFYNIKEFKKNKNYKFIRCDLNNPKKLKEIIAKYKPIGIFNVAAETHVDRSIDGPKNFINSNIIGTFNILEILRKQKIKIKLIHISTDEVFGDILRGRSKEDDAYKPSSPYAASKAASDHLVTSYIRTYKVPAIVTNCSNNFGPRQHPEKYGVAKVKNNKISFIKEKPKKFISDLAITGLYFFDNKVVKFAKQLKPSKRNELEITDLLNKYKKSNKLSADYIGRGGAWLDTGSLDDFYKTSAFVSAVENRQGFKIACLEEISLLNKWISKKQIIDSIKFYGNCEYSTYLKKLI